MTTTTQQVASRSECSGEPLPLDPYRSLRVRFGMLLGEEDFTTLGAYHRGKGWLHNAWLHRQGVVWGLAVELDPEKGEIRVLPGLALDGLGRELHLGVPMCVNLSAWLSAQDSLPVAKSASKRARATTALDLHVILRFRTCLDRQVPALSEPCEGSGATTAHSRVVEQVEILLRPGLAPSRLEPPLPYHRLRLLFGLEPPILQEGGTNPIEADQQVLDARAAIAAQPAADRSPALLEAFRRFAAYDEIELEPAKDEDGEYTLMPAAEPGELVLAELRQLRISGEPGAYKIESGPEVVFPEVRFSHVATATIEELLCGAACCIAAAAQAPTEIIGPEIREVQVDTRTVTLSSSAPLADASLATGIFLTYFEEKAGWSELAPDTVSQKESKVSLEFAEDLPSGRLRLLVRGSGNKPVLGADGVPLGARSDNPFGGNDFAFMIERK